MPTGVGVAGTGLVGGRGLYRRQRLAGGIDGVVRLRVKEGSQLGWCPGSLVNNTASDCRPFILTALHCGELSTADFQQEVLLQVPAYRMRPGIRLGEQGDDRMHQRVTATMGRQHGSDFLLVKPISCSAQPRAVLNGWDATGTGGSSGGFIHHPAMMRSKDQHVHHPNLISFLGHQPDPLAGDPSGTTNGHGVTGRWFLRLSDLQLGRASWVPLPEAVPTATRWCPEARTNRTTTAKMDRHWNSNPNPANEKLRVWLDPGNTGQTTFDGSYIPCGNVGIGERAQEEGCWYSPSCGRPTGREYPDGLTRWTGSNC